MTTKEKEIEELLERLSDAEKSNTKYYNDDGRSKNEYQKTLKPPYQDTAALKQKILSKMK